MIIQESMTLKRKLEILSDAAKYDVACTSSGVDQKGRWKGHGKQHCCPESVIVLLRMADVSVF